MDIKVSVHSHSAIGKALPCLRVTDSSRSGIFLRPQGEEAEFLLVCLARGEVEQFGISLDEVAVETRCVVLLYPVGLSLDPILADPRVAFARCTYGEGHGRKEPTRHLSRKKRGKSAEC